MYPEMAEERRQHKRFSIDCPVTVFTPGRGKKQMVGRGWLYDINDNGARFLLDHSLEPGDRISLEVGFQNPDGEITAIRFPGIVKRVNFRTSYEVAVSFLKGGSFVRRKGSRGKKRSPHLVKSESGYRWIN